MTDFNVEKLVAILWSLQNQLQYYATVSGRITPSVNRISRFLDLHTFM
jgi:hypothetical protein